MKQAPKTALLALLILFSQTSPAMEKSTESSSAIPFLTVLVPFFTTPLGLYILEQFHPQTTVTDLQADPQLQTFLETLPNPMGQCTHCVYLCFDETTGKLRLIFLDHPCEEQRLQILQSIIFHERETNTHVLRDVVAAHYVPELYDFLQFVFFNREGLRAEFLALPQRNFGDLPREQLRASLNQLLNASPLLTQLVAFLPWPASNEEGSAKVNCSTAECQGFIRTLTGNSSLVTFEHQLGVLIEGVSSLIYQNDYLMEYVTSINAGLESIPASTSSTAAAKKPKHNGCCSLL